MAEPKEADGGSSKTLFWVFFLLFAGIGAGASFLYKAAEKARSELEDAKREYQEMQQFKVIVARGKAQTKRLPNVKEGDGLDLPFLERKRAAAGIPQNIFSVQPLNSLKQKEWKETSYEVTLRGTKEAPVFRDAVADFVIAVETERPTVKSKIMKLVFLPSSKDFSSVSITFSQFQRESP